MYEIKVLPSGVRDLDSFDEKLLNQIKNSIRPLASNPRPSGCIKLSGEGGYRIRSGNYRILYRIDDKNKTIFIYRVRHRKESYR